MGGKTYNGAKTSLCIVGSKPYKPKSKTQAVKHAVGNMEVNKKSKPGLNS